MPTLLKIFAVLSAVNLLSCHSLGRVPDRPPKLRMLWTRNVPGAVSGVRDGSGALRTSIGRLDWRTGKNIDGGTHDPFWYLKNSPMRVSLSDQSLDAWNRKEETQRTVWRGRIVRLGTKGTRTILELGRTKTDVNSVFRVPPGFPSPITASGDPDKGWFLLQADKLDNNRDWIVHSAVLLSPLRLSPLKFRLFWDCRDANRVLGVSLPNEMTLDQLLDLRTTSFEPLSCGNVFSGRLLWTANSYAWGYWAANLVLAKHATEPYWSWLDADTGKVLERNVKQLMGLHGMFSVATSKEVVVAFETGTGSKGTGTTITGYEVI